MLYISSCSLYPCHIVGSIPSRIYLLVAAVAVEEAGMASAVSAVMAKAALVVVVVVALVVMVMVMVAAASVAMVVGGTGRI